MAGIYCVLDHFADEMVVLGGEDCVECLDFFIPGFYLIQDFRWLFGELVGGCGGAAGLFLLGLHSVHIVL